MKKISISMIGLLTILFTFTCHAQSVFSKQNLEKATKDELTLYLKQAKNQKTPGIILSIAGPVTVTSILVVAYNIDTNMSIEAAGTIFLVGTAATLMGIPLLILGSSRVNKVKNALSDRVSLEIAPCSFYNLQAQNYQPGVTLRIKF